MNFENFSIKELEDLIYEAQLVLARLREERWKKNQVESAKRSKAAAERKKKLEAEGEKLFDKIQIGSIVKVDGVRNRKYQHRIVVEIDKKFRQFTGRQMAFKKDGTVIYGNEFPTHMANKIRKIVDVKV